MCQFVLQDPAFFSFLRLIDQDHATTVRLQGCSCGGRLHQANYERKPRGDCGAADDKTRFSFCCADCRQRCTPESVRFLGRRVYWGAVVLLATALCSGLNLRRGQLLSQQIGVPVRTILRWRQWWLTDFTATAVWRDLCGRFMPPVAAGTVPGGLLARAMGDDKRVVVAKVLRWFAPLSTVTQRR